MKKNYNNTIMSGALSKALRVLALLCVLLGVSSSAWGKTLSEYKNGSYSIYLIGGFNNWTKSDNNFKLNSSDGNLYTGSFEVNAGTYTFKIYTSDNKYYSSESFASGEQKEFNDSNGDMELKTTSNTGKVKLDVELYLEYGGQSKLTINQSATGGDDDDDTGDGSGCSTTGNFYLTGSPVGGWGGYYWTQMQPTEDGKGHYYVLAQASGSFKMSNQTNYDDTFWKTVNVSSECSTITYDGNGGDASLSASNVYIKYNPCTGYIWTEPVNCTTNPVYTVPDNFTLSFGESIDLKKICKSTSDATITFTKKSGSAATLSGSTLTAGQTAGSVVIKASQALKSPYCSGSIEFTVNVVEKSIVLLAEDAKENADKSWTLSGYLELTDCEKITEYGFVLCGSASQGECTPTYTSNDILLSTDGSLEKGTHFTRMVQHSQLVSDWYAYRAYVIAGGEPKLSSETRYFSLCNNTELGDTIYVTIDNSLVQDSKCDFRFKSFENAWTTLKTYKEICTTKSVTIGNKTQDAITLLKPVVMQVVPTNAPYQGTEAVGLTGGDMNSVKAIFFRNINPNGGEPLIVRSIDKSRTRATLLHVAIRRSKNITLDYLNLTGSTKDVSTADNAIDIDSGEGTGNTEGLDTHWNCVTLGGIIDANIVLKNNYIASYGFTCIHVASYDGVTFENNEIYALYDFNKAKNISHNSENGTLANNTANWGASAKFLNSKNIKFVRNNFTGQHSTSILLQGSQNVLIYNNVFWHENAVETNANTIAIIRLVSYSGSDENNCANNYPLQNIGIYYNTMFLKNNTAATEYYTKFDFFRLGGAKQTGFTSNYKPASIEFDYNNCYSYDLDVTGKNTNYLLGLSEDNWCASFKYNNFWNAYEEGLATKPTKSAFELGDGCGTGNTFTNVQNLVCRTSPEEPGSLVIKDEGLNTGAYIKTDVSGLLTTDMQTIDRLGNARPYDVNDSEGAGKYTIGAYQQSEGSKVSQIIWHGSISTEWDNRNNWYKPNGQLVTCVDVLDEDLEVVIPAPNTTKYPVPATGVVKYPILPEIADDADFSRLRAAEWYNEEVTAGKGELANPTKIANKITMEYGAALIGVEELAQEGKTERYSQASTELIVPRSKWILVGPIIRPFNSAGKADDMLSGHYFIEKQEPHVFMHEAQLSGSQVSWKNPFPDLNVEVPANKVFAIQIPDMYGTGFMLPAEIYNEIAGTYYDGTKPVTYTFTGRFTNEAELPTYTGLIAAKPELLNNSYPANINIANMLKETGGTVQIYDYNTKAFREYGWTPVNGENSTHILAQHGFVYTRNSSGSLKISASAYETTNTEHRSIIELLPEVRIMLSNDNYAAGSDIRLSVDNLKDDVINYDTDAPKVFNTQETRLPDLYVMRYNEKWAGVTVPSMEDVIPLGIRVSASNQIFTFSLNKAVNLGSVILEDRAEGKNYDLLSGETCTVSDLEIGDCEGRFFLYLSEKEDEPNGDEEGDISTEVEEEFSDSGISIINNLSGVVVSCSTDMELQTIYINDMSGKTAMYNVSGQYIEIVLPVSQGVYTINVITDKASKTGKVILK